MRSVRSRRVPSRTVPPPLLEASLGRHRPGPATGVRGRHLLADGSTDLLAACEASPAVARIVSAGAWLPGVPHTFRI
jgi:hypothetical protein